VHISLLGKDENVPFGGVETVIGTCVHETTVSNKNFLQC
jgi:hypothetical protein